VLNENANETIYPSKVYLTDAEYQELIDAVKANL
jgi:hypothetical protein